MATSITLVVPPGAEAYPISEGTTQYVPYRADHANPASRWLIDVAPETAARLMHNGGFAMAELNDDGRQPPIAGMVPLRHPEGIGCTWAGTNYPADPVGIVLVPTAAVADLRGHGFVAPDAVPGRPNSEQPPRIAELETQLAQATAERDELSARNQALGDELATLKAGSDAPDKGLKTKG